MPLESLILDARGNPFQGSLDVIGGETVTDARGATAILGALNAETLMDLNGKAVISLDLRSAAFVGTVLVEGSIDGVNYLPNPLAMFDIATETMVTTLTGAGVVNKAYMIGVSGLRRVRTRVSAFTSGTIGVAMRGSAADFAIYSRPVPSTLHVSATGAAAAAVTLTLPAAGPGLFHYITSIHIVRAAAAALAGTAALSITTTNFPGSAAWSMGNAMPAGGTAIDLDYEPTTPVKSLAANTATTIVAPAPGAGVLWRLNCTYYVGA